MSLINLYTHLAFSESRLGSSLTFTASRFTLTSKSDSAARLHLTRLWAWTRQADQQVIKPKTLKVTPSSTLTQCTTNCERRAASGKFLQGSKKIISHRKTIKAYFTCWRHWGVKSELTRFLVFTGKQTPRSCLRTPNHPLVQQEGRKEKWKAGHWASVNLGKRRQQRSEKMFLKKIRPQKKSLSLGDFLWNWLFVCRFWIVWKGQN